MDNSEWVDVERFLQKLLKDHKVSDKEWEEAQEWAKQMVDQLITEMENEQ